ncbi:MAG: tyrosine-type recombinase/integrase [Planctomycetota bacterium]
MQDLRLAAARFPKARARPQPYFTTLQVDQIIATAAGEEQPACALMGYAGLQIGEVEQLQWQDIHVRNRKLTMIHGQLGGSNESTKDKDDRFVPIHPKVADLFAPLTKDWGRIFSRITERRLLKRLKALCTECGFDNLQQYKLHSFRHHFASLCARNRVA